MAVTTLASTVIKVRGKPVTVPSVNIEGRTVLATGTWLNVATVQDEELVIGDVVPNPESFVAKLKHSGLGVDLLTFIQTPPDVVPRYPYYFEWDNFAIMPITSYADWWDHRVEASVRRAVRKASKSGVTVKVADLDDAFIHGICLINDETPIRQGRRFWHYRKSQDEVRSENTTYPGRNLFLGAYYDNELIGYMRLIFSGELASTVQILSMMKHYDKRPQNALIARAVEECAGRGIRHLMYCNYVYRDPASSLTEFKRRNGFEKVQFPRYYVPLTVKGDFALRLGFHHRLSDRIPLTLLRRLVSMRTWWNEHSPRLRRGRGAPGCLPSVLQH
jgi:hypothetical protein